MSPGYLVSFGCGLGSFPLLSPQQAGRGLVLAFFCKASVLSSSEPLNPGATLCSVRDFSHRGLVFQL